LYTLGAGFVVAGAGISPVVAGAGKSPGPTVVATGSSGLAVAVVLEPSFSSHAISWIQQQKNFFGLDHVDTLSLLH
jgi:hypothetical protein